VFNPTLTHEQIYDYYVHPKVLQTMKIHNPVEYDSYQRKNRFTTTSSATWNRKSLEYPSPSSSTLEKLNKTFSHPSRALMDSKYMKITAQGYAKNNVPFFDMLTSDQTEAEEKPCRKSEIKKRQEKLDAKLYSSSGASTIYKREFQNPAKVQRYKILS
jgi:hypothetical protein